MRSKAIEGLWESEEASLIDPLIKLLKETGAAHGKTPAQVALNWTISKGTVPIPGPKNAKQAAENLGAMGWRLTPEEVAALDEASNALAE